MENDVVILVSHGTRSPLGHAAINALTSAVRARRPDVRFAAGYVSLRSPDPGELVRRHAAGGDGSRITIVPVLLSAGYHVRVDLRRAAHQAAGTRVAPALGPDPRIADLLAARLAQAGLAPGDGYALTLASAGSREAAAARDVSADAAGLERRLGRVVTRSHIAGPGPATGQVIAALRAQGYPVAVASYLLAPGQFASRLAGSGAGLVSDPLLPPGAADDPALVPGELVDLLLDRAGLGAAGLTARSAAAAGR